MDRTDLNYYTILQDKEVQKCADELTKIFIDFTKNCIIQVPIFNILYGTISDLKDKKFISNLRYELDNYQIMLKALEEKVNKLEKENKLLLELNIENNRELYFSIKEVMLSTLQQPDQEIIRYITNYLTSYINLEYKDFNCKFYILT